MTIVIIIKKKKIKQSNSDESDELTQEKLEENKTKDLEVLITNY